MSERVLVPASRFDPWARAVADTVTSMEASATAVPHLVHVFDEIEWNSTVQQSDAATVPDPDELAERKSAIMAAATIFDDAGFDYTVIGIESETPSRALLDLVDEANIDRIYMYGRKRSPAGKTVFGSRLQTILANSPVPVIVLPADAASWPRDLATDS
ncbi:hypothetical protein AUR64_03730 [Haloprofundus marisrubri]|uniref:UspA domain-containing protein n=1 Tax=Haloprofundus marisrubri TaxID=1514971 RepID=A0A0W1RE08_9EURY|nr:universal stress protein [Haloprofundus marisrubri]KTG11376.1 hypothetical protein AUR64_03730 [Haloprofundus marisrubri]